MFRRQASVRVRGRTPRVASVTRPEVGATPVPAMLIIRPWKSRLVQATVLWLLLASPSVLWAAAGGGWPWVLVGITIGPATWPAWRILRSRVTVWDSGQLEVRAVLRDWRFDLSSVKVAVSERQTAFSYMPQPCLQVDDGVRRWVFWTIADTSDDRVIGWVRAIEGAQRSESPPGA